MEINNAQQKIRTLFCFFFAGFDVKTSLAVISPAIWLTRFSRLKLPVSVLKQEVYSEHVRTEKLCLLFTFAKMGDSISTTQTRKTTVRATTAAEEGSCPTNLQRHLAAWNGISWPRWPWQSGVGVYRRKYKIHQDWKELPLIKLPSNARVYTKTKRDQDETRGVHWSIFQLLTMPASKNK